MPETFRTFGELLRHLRERAGLTQRELARQVGYHYSYISRLEKNERSPDASTLEALFIPALGLEDEPRWIGRLLNLAREEAAGIPAPGSQSALPPDSVIEESLHLLPISLTPLLGREQETARLEQLLRDEKIRLITLVGAPGVGKTRLALHLAHQMQEYFPGGVLFIDLTRASDARGVLPEVAGVLGLPEASEAQMLTRIVNVLKQKSILLVLDNFEHVLDAAPKVVLMIGNSPGVRALVTSREALNIPGEVEFPLHPLPVPRADDEALERAASIQLFIQRARAAQPNFQLTGENRQAVAEICRRLDGLPLAIELAAPRVKALSPQAMLRQFERRLDWAARNIHTPRQTLRGALDWSHNLLTEKSQALLRRLAVFSGGWMLPAVEAICASDDEADIQPGEVLDLLMQLADKSMIVAEPQGSETRYRFLETIRDFAREKLAQAHEIERYRSRHLAHFADMAETIEAHIFHPDRMEWVLSGEQEHSNLIAALEWGLHHPPARRDGMRLAAAINLPWLARSRFRDGLEYARAYLETPDDAPELQLLRARLLYGAGAMAGRMYDHVTARQLTSESLPICRAMADTPNLARALYHFGEACYHLKQLPEARAALEESLGLWRELNEPIKLARTLCMLGLVRYDEGDYKNACQILQEALDLATTLREAWTTSRALLDLGTIHRYHGNIPAATDCFLRSLDHRGDPNAEATAAANLSILFHLQKEYVRSGEYAERMFSIFQSLGDEIQLPFPLRMMAYAAIHAGDFDRARSLMRESLAGNRALGHLPGQLACLVTKAWCLLARAETSQAVALCALVETLMTQGGYSFIEPDAKSLRETLSAGLDLLGREAYESAYQLGRSLNAETEILHLLGDPETLPTA